MKIINVVGTRPNFMKAAPVMRAMGSYPGIEPVLVHTGQHYDDEMSRVFFHDLNMPDPDIYLKVGSGSRTVQIARIMEKFEKVLLKERPDMVIVFGDVNSALACALTSSALNVKIAHVEAGLRSFDRSMPEEINRVLTDQISDLLFTTCEDAEDNLLREGVSEDKIFFVGNVMIDTLMRYMDKVNAKGARDQNYAVLTLHRPSNVDHEDTFKGIIKALNKIADHVPIYFPVHPRTKKQIAQLKLEKYFQTNIKLMDPMGYLDFLKMYSRAKFILTDSGGLQEETTILDIPCLTIRNNTERPVTIDRGTNVLVGTEEKCIIKEAMNIINGKQKKQKDIKYWDGNASERIVKILSEA